jgi:hypothetical protein
VILSGWSLTNSAHPHKEVPWHHMCLYTHTHTHTHSCIYIYIYIHTHKKITSSLKQKE